ncbi:ankyrin repeat-containing domain, PGG domain protein [Artemisia annua]|uniref:Ankyrin repeat-containing domain, PGG domain protein n=1 Tax=Artemisia annua TaxID=35608 RepID=A0A2U1L4D2_ARTAN|nr:ankyrin repeat-containing domain, PGG domain protein [Artemisia annua]
MKGEDLELENKNYNTALCLAAAAGNLKVVKIMVEKNRSFLTVMPLHAAASAGNYYVVKYLFEKSSELGDDYWINDNRGCLLRICVETNMFEVNTLETEEFEVQTCDQNTEHQVESDHQNTEYQDESNPEEELETSSDDDNTIHGLDQTNNLTNNEGVMSDVVQENEPPAQEQHEENEPQAQEHVAEPRFPVRSTRGIPKAQYQADLKAKAKYPIVNALDTEVVEIHIRDQNTDYQNEPDPEVEPETESDDYDTIHGLDRTNNLTNNEGVTSDVVQENES